MIFKFKMEVGRHIKIVFGYN